MSEYLDTAQAAKELNITVASIYKIVNLEDPAKRLDPVNRVTHKGDGGYRFTREEIERIKPAYVKEDLTSAQAAKRIGRSTTYIHQLFKKGLPYYEAEFRGKRTYFIKKSDLEIFATNNPDSGKYDTIYDRKSKVYLFQPYRWGNRLARVCSMKRLNRNRIEVMLQVSTDERIPLERAIDEGWKPAVTITDRKAITSYGYAVFEFPLPITPDSVIYAIIDEFFKLIGPANLRIQIGEFIQVEVKKSVLTGILPATHPDMIDKLKTFIRSGEITPKFDGTLIDTGLSPVTFYLPEKEKAKLVGKAEEANKTLQEWLESTVSEAVEKEDRI
ncbi:helix-turn-helix domain-containing protein [Paenibacillus alkaliterrae]|nr:helix-turn-helix domain-containing protein [Paenibacillus alkaliterrae]